MIETGYEQDEEKIDEMEALLENDEMSAEEAAFMQGYDSAY